MEDLHVPLDSLSSAASTYDSVASLLGKTQSAPTAGADDMGHVDLQQWLSDLLESLASERTDTQQGVKQLADGVRDTAKHVREADEKGLFRLGGVVAV